jgi:hypothetical protein
LIDFTFQEYPAFSCDSPINEINNVIVTMLSFAKSFQKCDDYIYNALLKLIDNCTVTFLESNYLSQKFIIDIIISYLHHKYMTLSKINITHDQHIEKCLHILDAIYEVLEKNNHSTIIENKRIVSIININSQSRYLHDIHDENDENQEKILFDLRIRYVNNELFTKSIDELKKYFSC